MSGWETEHCLEKMEIIHRPVPRWPLPATKNLNHERREKHESCPSFFVYFVSFVVRLGVRLLAGRPTCPSMNLGRGHLRVVAEAAGQPDPRALHLPACSSATGRALVPVLVMNDPRCLELRQTFLGKGH
jgi:hypothetical protein